MRLIDETEYKDRLRKLNRLSEEEIDRQWKFRLERHYDHQWHVAINEFTHDKMGRDEFPHFMYEAKSAAEEANRLALLFQREREGKLAKVFRPCRCCPDSKHIEDNHTFCVLGKKCRECPYLLALEKADMPQESIDRAKAWTCITHILMNGGDTAKEGYVLTVDDRMFWDRVYGNLSGPPPETPAREEK